MPVKQGDLELLQVPVSQELLQSKIPARLAYIAADGTPRVVPIWFHWSGREFVMATPPKAPKLKALAKSPKVALTVDGLWPLAVRCVPMWGRLTKIVGLVLLVVTVVSVVSPWFDLHPTTLRTHRRAIILILAIPPILQSALPVSSFLLTKPPTLQSQQAYDIVARDCAWLC